MKKKTQRRTQDKTQRCGQIKIDVQKPPEEPKTEFAFTFVEGTKNERSNVGKWIVELRLEGFPPFPNGEQKIYKNRMSCTGSVNNAASKSLAVSTKEENRKLSVLNMVSKMGESLLSIGQLTENKTKSVKFKDDEGIIKNVDVIVAIARRVTENLYRIINEEEKDLVINIKQSDNYCDHETDSFASEEQKKSETENPTASRMNQMRVMKKVKTSPTH